MKIEINKFVAAMSQATDYVEAEILNVPPYHEKRVALLAGRMAEHMGMDEETVYALMMAGTLHDCALADYLEDEFTEDGSTAEGEINFAAHCITGEKVAKRFPFYQTVEGAILHHHDRADGGGAMGKTAAETPIYGQLLHTADNIDVFFSPYSMDEQKYREMREWVKQEQDTRFSKECCEVFLEAIDYPFLEGITGENCVQVLDRLLPSMPMDVPLSTLREMSEFFGHVTDYKSHFTWHHSQGVAEKAEKMGQFYGYDKEQCDKLYIAGSLHDIGKLLIPNDILEKPDKLTSEEYKTIQNHAIGTWKLLKPIGGMEDITRWAALHHEKLDGSGYPFGLTEADLSKPERLMACLDIYQALTEVRPYKAGMTHEEAMQILERMGKEGQLDPEIIKEIDQCFSSALDSGSIPKEEKTEATHYTGETWRCPVCGYVYEGSLPDDFICPQCEQPRSVFEQIQK